ncbi:MAG: hypothetical protein QOG05_6649 [Streptosporangiaceae bacterium]|jgi:hypothetical protein|nr:hypothetical protein [Streptosporangiaceae bacterium]
MSVPVTRSGRLTRPALLALAAGGAAVLAAGCGSQAATTSSATQPASPASTSTAGRGALCSDPAAVTRLLVGRVTALPQNHLHFAFPARVTVSSPARARKAAGAVCGLPAMPRTPMNCPADWGLSYRLSFAAGTRSFPVVTATAGGCGTVTGAGPARWTARSPGFWAVLSHAMGISTAAALQGTRPAPHTSPARPHTSPASPGIVPVG